MAKLKTKFWCWYSLSTNKSTEKGKLSCTIRIKWWGRVYLFLKVLGKVIGEAAFAELTSRRGR